MARGFRYPSYGTTGMYRYNQPTMRQYESFFNPIPIDFLQQELGKRQGRYDAAFAGALAAKDELANVQVGMADLASKNEIISQGIGDINKMVEDKYGGDWGRASKEVARSVSSLRANPFWNAQAEAQKQRDIAQELKIKYGSDAMIFNDPTTLSVMNAAGGIRSFEDFQPDIVQRGDWAKTARELMAGITPDANPWGLTRDEIDSFVKYGQVEEISRDKIEAFASDPAIQEAFLREHSEIRRGISELDEGQQQQFGLLGKTAQDVAKEQLLGAAASTQHKKVDMKVTQDQDLLNKRKAAREADPTVRPTTNPSEIIGSVWEGQMKPRDIQFSTATGTAGQIATVEERLARDTEPSVASMMPIMNYYGVGTAGIDIGAVLGRGLEGIKKLIRNSAEGNATTNPLWLIANTSKSIKEFAARAAEQKDKDYLAEVIKMYPNLAEYTPERAMKLANSANEKLGQKSNTLYNYGLDWQEAQTQNFVYDSKTKTPGRMFGQELYIDGKLISGEKKEKLFFEELGMQPGTEEAEEALETARVSDMAYTGNTPGEYIINVLDNKGVNHTIEMSPNREVQELATPSWAIAEYIRTGGQSSRLQDYEVSGMAPNVDEYGNLIVPLRAQAVIEGRPYPVFYQVGSEIVPTAEGGDEGIHQTDIKQFVIREDGQKFVINDGLELKDVIAYDQAQVEQWYKANRVKRQSNL